MQTLFSGQIPDALGLFLRSLKKDLWNKHDHCCPFKFGFMCSSDPSVFLGVVDTHPQTLHTCSERLQVQMFHTRGQNWKPDLHSDHLELSLCIIWRFSHDVGLKRKLQQHFMLISTCMKHFNLHNILITQCHGGSLSLPRLPSPLSRPAPASSFTFCTVRVSFPLISLSACLFLCPPPNLTNSLGEEFILLEFVIKKSAVRDQMVNYSAIIMPCPDITKSKRLH